MFQKMASFAGVGVYQENLITGEVTWSSELYQILGYGLATVPGKNSILALVNSSTQETLNAWFEDAEKDDLGFQIKVAEDKFKVIIGKHLVSTEVGENTRLIAFKETVIKEEYIENPLIKNSPDAILVMDSLGNILQVNDVVSKILGYEREQITGMNIRKIFYETYDVINPPDFSKLLVGEPKVKEWLLKDAEGNKIQIEASCVRHPNNIVQTIFRDNTLRKNVEEALKLSENLNRRLVENSPVAILIQNLDREIVFANKFTATFLGAKSTQELVGTVSTRFTLPEYEEEIKSSLKLIFETGKAAPKFEQVFKRLDGTFKTGESIIIPFEYYGEPTILMVISDITEEKRAINALETSRRKLSFFIENAPAAVAMFDKKMNYIACSNRWIADWWVEEKPVTPNDIIGLNHYEVFPDVPQYWRDGHDLALRGIRQAQEEDVFTKRDGTREWLRWETKPWFNAEGDIGGIMVYTEFITQRKLAEEAIVDSERRTKALLNAIPDLIFILSEAGEYIDFEAKDTSRLLIPPEQIIGKNVRDIFDNEFAEKTLNAITKAIRTDRTQSLEYSLTINGEYFYFESRIVKYREARVLAIVRDITKNKQDEMAAAKSRERFYKSFHISPIPITISTVGDGVLIDVNDSFLELAGYSREEVIGKSALRIGFWKVPGDRQRFIHELRTNGKVYGFESEMETRFKDVRNIVLSAELMEINNEPCILLMMFDITERKKAEIKLRGITEELSKYNRELQQFAYITSHNLRAPVVNLASLVGFYDKSAPTSEDNAMIFEKIEKSVEQLNATLTDLVEIVAVKKNASELKTEVSFQDLLEDIKIGIEDQIAVNNVSIVEDFSSAPSITYPKTHLHSIFQNLLTNAIKYRSQHRDPVIKVSTEYAKSHILVRIEDNGSGIDMKKYGKKLFGLYQRFHEGIEGKGMGLYIVKSQIEDLGGEISVESKPEEGTVFKLFLQNFKKSD